MVSESGLSLVMSRPALIAFPFRHLMERNKRGEVALSCMFQLWKIAVVAKRWRTDQSAKTDVSKKDVEGGLPTMQESKNSAASFACIEQLGVSLPPSEGWKPRASGDENTISEEDKEKAEWWAHPKSADWIYQSSEGMYFHVPTSTLWERRDLECCDPGASSHTYFRVDAVHLQALAQFARSMDSAVLPMAWKAWVQYMRKKKGHGVAPPGSPTNGARRASKSRAGKDGSPPGSPGGSPGRSKKPRAKLATVPDVSEVVSPVQQGPDAKPEPGALPDAGGGAAPVVPAGAADPLDGPGGSKGAGYSLSEPTSAAEADKLKATTKKKGSCLWSCFGGRRRSGYDDKGAAPEASKASLASPLKSQQGQADRGGPADGPKGARTPSKAEIDDSARSKDMSDRSSARVDTDERHSKRLNQFFEDVKKNPARLVTHVERRRAEKTYLAFIIP